MFIRKLWIVLFFLGRNKYPLILTSLFVITVLSLTEYNIDSPVRDVISFFAFIPFLLLAFYLGLFVAQSHLQNKRRTIISVVITIVLCMIVFVSLGESYLTGLIQTLLSIPIIVGWIYLFVIAMIAQPEESFPTFKKLLKAPKKFTL